MGNADRTDREGARADEGPDRTGHEGRRWGMSTGLIYLPGRFSETPELIALARVVAQHGGMYASHMRNEGENLLRSIDEILRIGKEAGLPVHVSHLKASGKASWGLTTPACTDRRSPQGRAGDQRRPVSLRGVEHQAGGDGDPRLGPAGRDRGLQPSGRRPRAGPKLRREIQEGLNARDGGARSASPVTPRAPNASARTCPRSPPVSRPRPWRSSSTSSGTAAKRSASE